jgi:hypothetical protein
MEFKSNFEYDLKIGQVMEKRLAEILQDMKIEVKTDLIAHKTGNIAIEYQCRGKPSGIAVTHADYYAYVIPNAPISGSILLMPVHKLKEICRLYYNLGRIVNGGDENLSKMVLIPIEKLLTYKNA